MGGNNGQAGSKHGLGFCSAPSAARSRSSATEQSRSLAIMKAR